MTLAEKLIYLRKEKGLSQLKLAEMLDISRQAVSRWEAGTALPSTENLKNLSERYGVPVDYLLNDSYDLPEEVSVDEAEEGVFNPKAQQKKLNTKKYIIVATCILAMIIAGIVLYSSINNTESLEFSNMESENWESTEMDEFAVTW